MKYFISILLLLAIFSLASCRSLDPQGSNLESVSNSEEKSTLEEKETSLQIHTTDTDFSEAKISDMLVYYERENYHFDDKDTINKFFDFFVNLETTPMSKEDSERIHESDGASTLFAFYDSNGAVQYFIFFPPDRFEMVGKLSTNNLIHTMTDEKVLEYEALLDALPFDKEHEYK